MVGGMCDKRLDFGGGFKIMIPFGDVWIFLEFLFFWLFLRRESGIDGRIGS